MNYSNAGTKDFERNMSHDCVAELQSYIATIMVRITVFIPN